MYGPVIAGVWKQRELWDGTYTLDDLLDAHEMMIIKQENKRRAQAYAELIGGQR